MATRENADLQLFQKRSDVQKIADRACPHRRIGRFDGHDESLRGGRSAI
jgi:hypothetical protein